MIKCPAQRPGHFIQVTVQLSSGLNSVNRGHYSIEQLRENASKPRAGIALCFRFSGKGYETSLVEG